MTVHEIGLQKEYGMFIGGQFVPSISSKVFPAVNPANQEKLADVASGTGEDVDRAVNAAWDAYQDWSKRSNKEKATILNKAADEIEKNATFLATIETLDNGKPIGESLFDVSDVVDQFRYFAGCLLAEEGGYIQYDPNCFSILTREPLGVVAQIIPWNYPLSMAGWKLAPALAAGNCTVIKPASNTSLSILEMARLIKDIIPPGVINIVTGSGKLVGEALINHPRIRKIAFTGSTEIGMRMGEVAGRKLIPSTLELGGKSANIIFPDCQFERALIGTCAGILFNQGQVCSAGSRAFVHEAIYEKFVDGLIAKFKLVKVGNGLDPDTKMGPVIDGAQLQKNLDYVEIGKQEGARLAFGGTRLTEGDYGKGFFLAPTLFIDVDNRMRIAQEEIFGPVLVVIKFHDEEEVIALANDSRYGLAGGVWTQDINRAIRVARGIQAGTVWVNEFGPVPPGSSFGGYKDSGYGREVHKQALDLYSQKKNIFVNLNEVPDNSY
ncbi:aldehyde dehydrogenase family protein [Candidatus Formimonas warabiya]|uniref:Aldehyde dehydrogenase n=1 Tax=Formimonas warabiya TaxID=1761012 RepID=A0A3G1KQQ7_FORW1|nr:aldehyde dehydrogenase family protein [Candidatus Formimonas warabiya]ATW24791.1 aldehyde dehydrogenase [Candidatus Formimonas warabiya]